MLDKKKINRRFFECYADMDRQKIQQYFDSHHSAVGRWYHGTSPVPWKKLKHLVDTRGISWDWLLEGAGARTRAGGKSEGAKPFDRKGINRRALSVFEGELQEEVASLLCVSQSAVSSWKNCRRQVPWEKLKMIVDTRGVSWNWLIEGEE